MVEITVYLLVVWLAYIFGVITERDRWCYNEAHRMKFNGKVHSPGIWPK